MMGIYKFENQKNGKCYIGQSVALEARYWSHFRNHQNSNLRDYNTKFYRALRKYGFECFTYSILEQSDYFSKEELNEKEKYWIKKYNAKESNMFYNLRAGGDCGPGGPMFTGHKHSEETRRKMSENRKGSKNSNYGNRWSQSQELKQLHSKLSTGKNNGMYGKKHTEESKNKMSESKKGKPSWNKGLTGEDSHWYGKHHSEETRQKMSQTMSKKHWYNNGIEQIRSEICPDGFVPGMIKVK